MECLYSARRWRMGDVVRQVIRRDGLTLWQLAVGGGSPICVVDFARFADVTTLAVLLASSGDRPVYRIDAVADLGGRQAGGDLGDMADVYCGLLAEAGVVPKVVTSYCSTASLAIRIHARLPERCAMVMVEPTWPSEALVAREASEIIQGLGGDPTGIEVYAGDLADVSRQLRLAVRQALGPSTEDELEMERVLVERYEAWLGFLAMSQAVGIPDCPKSAVAILSPDGGYELPPGWTSSVPVHVVERPHDDLLEYPDVRDLILAL